MAKVADASEHSGSKGVEGSHLVFVALAPVGPGAALVAGVEEAAELVVVGEVGVHLVEGEDGLVEFYQAEQDRRGDAFYRRSPLDPMVHYFTL